MRLPMIVLAPLIVASCQSGTGRPETIEQSPTGLACIQNGLRVGVEPDGWGCVRFGENGGLAIGPFPSDKPTGLFISPKGKSQDGTDWHARAEQAKREKSSRYQSVSDVRNESIGTLKLFYVQGEPKGQSKFLRRDGFLVGEKSYAEFVEFRPLDDKIAANHLRQILMSVRLDR